MLAQSLALLVDVAVGAPAEVDALKRAGAQFLGGHDLLQMTLSVAADNERLAGLKLTDVLSLQVKRRLQYGALAGNGHHLVVAIVEGRTDAPRVAHGEHLARSRQAAHHVAAVVVLHRSPQHVGHLYVVVNIVGDVRALQTLFLCDGIQPLHLAVEPMAHQFEGDVRVAIDTRRLAL